MEYPTLVTAAPAAPAVAHELAHQWWYGLAGNNQYARYVITVYFVGARMLQDLERTLGSDRMLRMLRTYAAANRYGIATPAEFGAAARSAAPSDLTAFWERWRVDV